MSATHSWIGRLSIPALILVHVSGAVIGAALFFVLGALVIGILQIKDDRNVASIAAAFFLVGAILPSVLLWRARNTSLRTTLPPPWPPSALEHEFISTVSPTISSSEEAPTVRTSTETPPATPSDQPVHHDARIHLVGDVAAYNRAQKYTLSAVLLVLLIVVIFLSSVNTPTEPSAELELELTRKGALFEEQGNAVEILNVGSKPVKITGMLINDRADCTISGVSIFTEGVDRKPLPTELKVGDTLAILSSCRIIRVAIETDIGSKTYSFRRE